MKPQHTLGRATTPDGRELILHERDGASQIRAGSLALLSIRARWPEEKRLSRDRAQVFIGDGLDASQLAKRPSAINRGSRVLRTCGFASNR